MRATHLSSSALALVLASFPARPAPAEPMHQLVVQVERATAPGSLRTRRVELSARLQPLGLRVVGSLGDGIPGTLGVGATERSTPFDLDPARIFLVEADDSLAARSAAERLAHEPGIDWVEFNQWREPALASLEPGFPNDPMFLDSRQWGLRNIGPGGAYGGVAGADIHALEAWGWSVGSNDVILAVADTGIDPDHPELQMALPGGGMRVTLGMNVTTDPATAFADSFGHGTPVTGVVAARTGEGAHFDSLGVAGVCGGDGGQNFGCRIVPIKITPGRTGNATSYDISRAILYATSVGARAMNLSFAGSSPSRLERNALYHAITHGCVVVAASGNRGGSDAPQPHQYPAVYAAEGFCVQVGATDSFDHRAGFSSYGPGLDLVAPGLDIWTTFMTYRSAAGALRNGYVRGSGTSFAAPFATGTVGLLAAARPELEDTDFQNLLRTSADDIDDPGVDERTGWGRLNAARALESVRPTFGIWHDETPALTFEHQGIDSLLIGESGPGNLASARHWPVAQRIEASATVALPDSFLDSVRVWPRVGGTTTVRGDFRIPYFAPWAQIVAIEERSFTIQGYLYHLVECLDCVVPEDAYLPLPPDEERFGFTVIGRVDRPPTLRLGPLAVSGESGDSVSVSWSVSDPDQVTAVEVWLDGVTATPLRLARVSGAESGVRLALPCGGLGAGSGRLRLVALDEHGRHHDRSEVEAPIALRLRDCAGRKRRGVTLEMAPNPFQGFTRIAAPAGARITIVDVAGRIVRRATIPAGSSQLDWDGRDDQGRRLGPGIYLVRSESPAGRARAKLLKLE